MKTEIQDLGGSRKNITFQIPSEEVEEEIQRYCKKLAKEVDVKGFRKGKAPVSIIRRYFKEQIQKEVSSQLVASSVEKTVKENALTPLGEPKIDAGTLVEGKDFTFSVTMDVLPKVEVKDYTGIEVVQEQVRVTEQDVDTALESLRKAHAQMKKLQEDRPAGEGDVVLVDYQGTLAGKPFAGGRDENVYIEIGSGKYPAEVEGALVGLRPGESATVKLTFPDAYAHKEIAGKTVDYAFTVKGIYEKELPALDDEFAKDVGRYAGLSELKDALKDELVREKTARVRRVVEERLLDRIIERNPVEPPSILVEERHRQLMEEARQRFQARGLLVAKGTEEYERLDADLRALAEKQVLKDLMVDAIAKKENIEVTDQEVEERLKTMAERSGQSVDRLKGELQRGNGLERLKRSMRDEKTLDFLLSRAKIEIKE
jgi:trigger factor